MGLTKRFAGFAHASSGKPLGPLLAVSAYAPALLLSVRWGAPGRTWLTAQAIVLFFFAVLAWRRWPRAIERTGFSRVVAGLMVLAGLAGMASSAIVGFRWLVPGIVLCAGGLIPLLGGGRAVRELLPCWLMVFVAVLLPSRIFAPLFRELDSVMARTGSLLLDWVGVDHLLTNGRLELSGGDVVAGLSGLDSYLLPLMIAAGAVLVMARRRPVPHALLLLAASALWAAAIGVAAIVLAGWRVAMPDVAQGIGRQQHLILCGLLLAGPALLWSTDELLVWLLSPVFDWRRVDEDPILPQVPLADDLLSRLWNLSVVGRCRAGERSGAS